MYLKERDVPHIWNVDDEGHTPKTWASNLYHFAQRIFRDGRRSPRTSETTVTDFGDSRFSITLPLYLSGATAKTWPAFCH